MKENAFLSFKNPLQFIAFLNELKVLNSWKINSGSMNSRGNFISEKRYTAYLKNRFNEKQFFRRSVSVSEIVSWLDSFVIMKRIIKKLSLILSPNQYSEIEIYCEYVIEMSKLMRVDFVFKYKETILLIEFRMVNDFEKIKTTWTKKKTELLIYKELCENYIPKNQKILTFAFISLFEYDGKELVESHYDFNNNQVDFICEYIKKYMIQ